MSEKEKGVEMEKEVRKSFFETAKQQSKNIFEEFSKTVKKNKEGSLSLFTIFMIVLLLTGSVIKHRAYDKGLSYGKNQAFENQLDYLTVTLSSVESDLSKIVTHQPRLVSESTENIQRGFYERKVDMKKDKISCLEKNIKVLKNIIYRKLDIEPSQLIRNCSEYKGFNDFSAG